jgi:hypothetical protein
VLEVDYVVAGDLSSLGGVIILAVGVRPFAGTASRQPGIASRLALGVGQYRSAYQGPLEVGRSNLLCDIDNRL